jgi:hypothetical protein
VSYSAIGRCLIGAVLWFGLSYSQPDARVPLDEPDSSSAKKAPSGEQKNRTQHEQPGGKKDRSPPKPDTTGATEAVAKPLQTTTNQKNAEPSEQGQDTGWSWLVRFFDFTLADAVVATFTGLLWWLTAHQLKAAEIAANAAKEAVDATREANNITYNAYVADQRPWVFHTQVTPIKVLDEAGDVSGYEFTMEWVNAGRSPAIRCRCWGGIVTRPPSFDVETLEFERPGPDVEGGASAPNVPFDGPARFVEIDMLILSSMGRGHVFIWEHVDYFSPIGRLPRQNEHVMLEIICVSSPDEMRNPDRSNLPLFRYKQLRTRNTARECEDGEREDPDRETT